MIPEEAVEAAIAHLDEALTWLSDSQDQDPYDQGYDDAIRGLAVTVKNILTGGVPSPDRGQP